MSELASLETVWAVCPYLRDKDCDHCPRSETVYGHEGCVRGCFALAEEAVNIAQTGNAWRKASSTGGVETNPAGQALDDSQSTGGTEQRSTPKHLPPLPQGGNQGVSSDSAPVFGHSGSHITDIELGQTYEHWWPFRRETYSGPPDFSDKKTWAPGFTREMYGPDDVAFEFDGEGHELRTIVSIHALPKPYKPRIFYLRQWRDPDGKLFGRGKLWVCGEQAFRNWQAGKKVEFLEVSREENACVEGYGMLVWPVVGTDGLRVAAVQS